jgi:hypothetical protein
LLKRTSAESRVDLQKQLDDVFFKHCVEKHDEHCHRRLLAERIQGLFSVDYRGELPSFAKENKG